MRENKMNVRQLTSRSFDRYPVWAWTDDERLHRPIENATPLPEDVGPLFVRARFVAADGTELKGYLVTDAGSVFAIGILIDDRELVFNKNLPDMAGRELSELFSALGRDAFQVFPLRYQAEFHFPNESNLKGIFELNK
jgi:hypothetical protein